MLTARIAYPVFYMYKFDNVTEMGRNDVSHMSKCTGGAFMKKKIVTILLTLSMVLSSIISPLEIEAKTGTTDRQSVEWNGKNCEYEVILPAG